MQVSSNQSNWRSKEACPTVHDEDDDDDNNDEPFKKVIDNFAFYEAGYKLTVPATKYKIIALTSYL